MPTFTLGDDRLSIQAGSYSDEIAVSQIARNWDALSHYPERHAAAALHDLNARLTAFAAHLDELQAMGGSLDVAAEAERFTRRHIEVTRAWWHAESRCMSSFIVGPANFPTRRSEKRQATAHKRMGEIGHHVAAARKAVERRAFPNGRPDGPVRGSNPDAADLLRQKIEERERRQAAMKMANKAIQKNRQESEETMAQAVAEATGWSLQVARAVIAPNAFAKRGFEVFELSNNNAEIRRLRSRLAGIEAKQQEPGRDTEEDTATGPVRVVENVEADRIQLMFEGKPEEAVRRTLKGLGFRWSPSHGAWQRHLNNAGRHAVARFLQSVKTGAEACPS